MAEQSRFCPICFDPVANGMLRCYCDHEVIHVACYADYLRQRGGALVSKMPSPPAPSEGIVRRPPAD